MVWYLYDKMVEQALCILFIGGGYKIQISFDKHSVTPVYQQHMSSDLNTRLMILVYKLIGTNYQTRQFCKIYEKKTLTLAHRTLIG